MAQSQRLAAFPGISACILEVKLHFNPGAFPHSRRLCEYLFDKQAVKHFPPDLIGEEFTFLFAASKENTTQFNFYLSFELLV